MDYRPEPCWTFDDDDDDALHTNKRIDSKHLAQDEPIEDVVFNGDDDDDVVFSASVADDTIPQYVVSEQDGDDGDWEEYLHDAMIAQENDMLWGDDSADENHPYYSGGYVSPSEAEIVKLDDDDAEDLSNFEVSLEDEVFDESSHLSAGTWWWDKDHLPQRP